MKLTFYQIQIRNESRHLSRDNAEADWYRGYLKLDDAKAAAEVMLRRWWSRWRDQLLAHNAEAVPEPPPEMRHKWGEELEKALKKARHVEQRQFKPGAPSLEWENSDRNEREAVPTLRISARAESRVRFAEVKLYTKIQPDGLTEQTTQLAPWGDWSPWGKGGSEYMDATFNESVTIKTVVYDVVGLELPAARKKRG